MQPYSQILRAREGLPTVDLFRFYSRLENMIRKKPDFNERKKAVEYAFTREEVEIAASESRQLTEEQYQAQKNGIFPPEVDMLAVAMEMGYLRQEGEDFHVVEGHVASYTAMLRRI